MILDLYGNRIVALKTAAQQTVNPVPDSIRPAGKIPGELRLRSGQGVRVPPKRI